MSEDTERSSGVGQDTSSDAERVLAASQFITGEVTDGDDEGIEGVEVTVRTSNTEATVATATTNASGDYTASVAADTYDVTASKLGYRPLEQTGVTVGSGETKTVDFSTTRIEYKLRGDFAEPYGAGAFGRNSAASGQPIGVYGSVPNASEGYGLATPDDARIDGVLQNASVDTDGNDYRVAAGTKTTEDAQNVVTGHAANTVSAGVVGATISGGGRDDGTSATPNVVHDDYGTIAGGRNNVAGDDDGSTTEQPYATVSGGISNRAVERYSTVGGGNNNRAGDASAGVGTYTTIGGGGYNQALAYGATVAGGTSSEAQARYTTVGGGGTHRVYDEYGTVAGGYNNRAGTDDDDPTTAPYTTVGGGYRNEAEGGYSTVTGGRTNDARGEHASVGGGYGNVAVADNSRVGGGYGNYASDEGATVGGGDINRANGLYATIAGGGPSDTTDNSTRYDTRNEIFDDYATIGGGGGNVAGYNNSSVDGTFSTVSGGKDNQAWYAFATIPGGESNRARRHCFAAGRNAHADLDGSFVWADDHDSTFTARSYNSWNARCRGGARFVTSLDSSDNPDAGVVVYGGSGSWASLSASASKTNVDPIEPAAVLDGVRDLDINTWQYKTEDGVDHLGPMAEDFHAAFGLGPDDEHITTVDADGVALAAIQGLADRLDEAQTTLAQRDEQVDALRERVADLEATVSALGAAEQTE